MSFKTMDPDKIRELIDGSRDIIAEAAERESTVYANATCPNCYEKGSDKHIDPCKVVPGPDGEPVIIGSPFSPNRPLARGYAKCRACGTEYDPESGIIRKPGYDPAIAE